MNADASVEFLQRVHPDRLWALTAIRPDRKGIETKTFDPASEVDAAREWIARYNGKRNLYFHVNAPHEKLGKKAEKTDVTTAQWLHVDLDCRAGEDRDAELERLRQLVVEENSWPDHLPRPQCVLFSGGGYQCFWRLDEPFVINKDVAAAEELERYNKALELALGGDNCHNVDRIMRLPGTLNIPDENKLKKGRVPVVAELLFCDDGTVSLEQMPQAPKLQTDDGPAPRGHIAKGATVAELDELDAWGISDKIKVLIAQGALPQDEQSDKQRTFSRSEWLFYAICDLVRHEVPDETILAIITDPGWAISEHVLAQKGDTDKYAVKQIEKAREQAVNPMLRTLNERYAVIKNLGGKCLVVEEVLDDAVKRPRLTKVSFPNFQNAWCNKLVQVGKKDKPEEPIYKPAGKWWLEHPLRREYDRLVFAPNREVEGAYNLWQGFAVEPRPGDCTALLAHVRDNVCRGDPTNYAYLLGWMASAVQHPDEPGHAAVVLRGRQGTGKSFFAKGFGSLFGRHFLQVADAKHMVGNFNHHLRDCVVLFGDEAFYAGDRKHESVLKTLVTEEIIHYESKGVDSEQGRNYVHLIMASNSNWVVPADMDDRRFFVLDVSEEHAQDTRYFRAIAEQMENGGREALLHYLLNYDLDDVGFEVRNVPKTAAKDEQKLFSASKVRRAVYELLLSGDSRALAVEGREVFIATEEVLRRFSLRPDDQHALGRELRVLARDGKAGRLMKQYERERTPRYERFVAEGGNERPRGVWGAPLDTARALFAQRYGLTLVWDRTERDWDDVDLDAAAPEQEELV